MSGVAPTGPGRFLRFPPRQFAAISQEEDRRDGAPEEHPQPMAPADRVEQGDPEEQEEDGQVGTHAGTSRKLTTEQSNRPPEATVKKA